jgi:dGTPase
MAKRSPQQAASRHNNNNQRNATLYRPPDSTREFGGERATVPVEAYRSGFRRDFQRLSHSPSFRRLQGKTQLFPSEEHDFYRTRLTHSLEVAQIAKSIAIRLNNTDEYFSSHSKANIDLDIVEFAGLAHDLGHPPFGHNGEYVLDELMLDSGGFEGNAQTLRILTRLEKKTTTQVPVGSAIDRDLDVRRGLNLTCRSLASILKYDDQIPNTKDERQRRNSDKRPHKGYYGCDAETVRFIKANVGDLRPNSRL